MYLHFLLYCKHKVDESPRKIRWKCTKLKRYETTYTIRGNTSCLCMQAGNEHHLLPCRYPNDSSLRTALPLEVSVPPCSQSLRFGAADQEGMPDLKLSRQYGAEDSSPLGRHVGWVVPDGQKNLRPCITSGITRPRKKCHCSRELHSTPSGVGIEGTYPKPSRINESTMAYEVCK